MREQPARKKLKPKLQVKRRYLKAVNRPAASEPVSSAVSLDERKDEYIVYVAVPGLERKDFSVIIINKKLVVSAAKKEAIHFQDTQTEQLQETWKETFILPDDADTVMTAAIYKNGELEIHIPRGLAEINPSPVEVVVY